MLIVKSLGSMWRNSLDLLTYLMFLARRTAIERFPTLVPSSFSSALVAPSF